MLVKDLFQQPDQAPAVLRLSEALANPRVTSELYVATPRLVDAMDRALGLIGSALGAKRSQAAYLHGSFGSGKSHFMAMVCLLLRGDEDAWRIPELHELRARHADVVGRKLVQLDFHFIGKSKLEVGLFARYVEFVTTHHPTARLPGLFADTPLFDAAARFLDTMGDEAFFGPLNQGDAGADDSAWGALAGPRWTRERFEEARGSADVTRREELFTALVRSWFKDQEGITPYVGLDEGLARLTTHAKSLGYEGCVFFLDEVVMWLATGVSDHAWFQGELQKLVKLVESQHPHAIPLVSFLARQRDLAEMVGDSLAGIESAQLRESLRWSEGRFSKIELANENLPTIVERRILRPKDAAAKAELDGTFERLKTRLAGDPTWAMLLGNVTAEEFRKLYPFSPTLVDCLVALSDALQRTRTGINLVSDLLANHIDDVETGSLVGVGDLFDVLASSEDPPSEVMRARFTAAKHLYRGTLLPLIQEKHGTTTPERCQRVAGQRVSLGCSNCKERACRADNRLVKTLLLAALVPEVRSLKDLTVSRLVQLNHGSLRVLIPGTEARDAKNKLADLASRVGQIHLGDQQDPTVRIEIEFIDLERILQQAEQFNGEGARQFAVRDLLFDRMGVQSETPHGKDLVTTWRGTKREGHLRFGNVRELADEAFDVPEGDEFRVVVDYPFDKPEFGPHDDERTVERLSSSGRGGWTIVWLPSFFSAEMERMLGDLVILNKLLASDAELRPYLQHLTVTQQLRAKDGLQNLREQKKRRIEGALEAAYGLRPPQPSDLDPARKVDRHFHILNRELAAFPAIPGFEKATELLAHAILDTRFPRHPKLGVDGLSRTRIDQLVQTFGEIADADGQRKALDRTTADLVGATLERMGLVHVRDQVALLSEDGRLAEIDRARAQRGLVRPTVAEMRPLLDVDGARGLKQDLQDLYLRCWARWAQRTLVHGTRAFEARAAQPLPDGVVFEKPDLPSPAVFAKALEVVQILGETFANRACNPDSVKKLEDLVSAKVASSTVDARRLVTVLSGVLERFQVDLGADRLVTARDAVALLDALRDRSGREQAEVLASFPFARSARATAESLAEQSDVLRVLTDRMKLDALTAACAQEGAAARALHEQLVAALRQDQVNARLAPIVEALAQQALELLTRGAATPPPAVVAPTAAPRTTGSQERRFEARGRAAVKRALVDVATALESSSDDVTVEVVLREPEP